jgi:3',5'-cyclic AMP phosphodiesterase CpdA
MNHRLRLPFHSSTLAGIAFLALALLVGQAAEVNLLVFGDWGQTNNPQQRATAQQMAAYSVRERVKFDAALLLGDNFYSKMPGGVNDPRWGAEFENAYDAKVLAMPFYAALGNHDYEEQKAATQLAYAKAHPDGRWKMPAKWYRVELPAERPLVSVLVLDSNGGTPPPKRGLTAEEWAAENRWLETELAKPRPGKWLVVTAHHPLYTAGQHGDGKALIERWGPLFEKHQVDFFLAGHDHDLQHLEMGKFTTFILAGGGGAKIRPMKRDDRGPFSRSLNGFLHLHLSDAEARGKFIAADGKNVHEFTRALSGPVNVVTTTGRDKPGKDKGE